MTDVAAKLRREDVGYYARRIDPCGERYAEWIAIPEIAEVVDAAVRHRDDPTGTTQLDLFDAVDALEARLESAR